MSKIVSIHSFRGGTGKSNSTANLAALVARSGKRVGIVDTDIQSPGIHVLFGFNDEKIKYTLNDYLWGNCAIEDTAYDVSSVLKEKANQRNKIYLIPSSIKARDITRILREGFDFGMLNDGLQDLIDELELDYLFIDTHPGLNEETLLSLTISDILVLILRPDNQDFQGTAVTVEVARKLQVPKMLLLINKALPALDFDALRQQVEKIYNAPVAGILPLSDEMVQLASSDLFCLRYSNHPISQEMQKVAKQIMQSN
ncbi:MinD/ParA family ATP-binding protein [Allocoleopsis franciscana]|uniref:ATPase involved in chromosome partitioning n=1 Tax=Allocoleopsis franciscana PCC 7113 TaxID=1173027 RepID=K9W976_9CYAN|nr:MinD/ParA family protein [Allocoleopsis franciscana]AFZ16945.1 ATPase involved in chromosome partitioning [Allocoleopsis franciscana PCC 7113]